MSKSNAFENISTVVHGHWSLNLVAAIKNPELILEEDDRILIIKDKYPKARFHYLVLPKKYIPAISKVTKDDLQLLHHMESTANKFVAHLKKNEFLIGYHSVPSMYHLHLHLISTDFDSPCLKTKHHWNAFTTPFFLHSKDVCKELEETGEIKVNTKEKEDFLKKDLTCHKCSFSTKTMPALKRHIIQHISE